jgi:hypothetical protein
MIEAPAEVPESQAEGKIKATYDDVKATLRIPYVPDLIRALAIYPNYLQLAWIALKPNSQTVYFERQSDRLRRTAADLTSRFPHPQWGDQSLAPSFQTLWYAAPKELLVTSALRSATMGQQPRLAAVSAEDQRRIPRGIPEGAVVPVRGQAPGDDEHRAVYEEMSAGLDGFVPVEYAVLAAFPAALAPAWRTIKALQQDLEYRRIQRAVVATVEEAITGLPFRMDISTHVLRHGGLSEVEIDAVQHLLSRYETVGRRAVPNIAILSASGGDSPYPVALS